ncbi:MAG: DUF4071 domain-containing protein [Candidatus Sabulitectum sp.]|nr:DUF4071 domain-containing protein [Candidatus Sabulitectum sp.]
MERLLAKVSTYVSLDQWDKAENILNKLIMAKPWDRSLLLAKAHLRKKMWMASGCEDHELLEESIRLFSRCHLITGSVEAGINSATLLLLSGKEKEAVKRADDTARHCRQLIIENNVNHKECYAETVAEVNLLKGRLDAAESWYKTAISKNEKISENAIDNMNLLLEYLIPEEEIETRIREAVAEA